MKKEVTPQDIEQMRKSTVNLHQAFPGDNVAVAVFCSREYLPIAATTLQSVIAHTSLQRNYDLLIVSSGVLEEEAKGLQSLVRGRENCSIRVVDGSPFMELLYQGLRQEDFWWNLHECLRLYVPFVCRNYEKVVCLAADVIAQTDVAGLYDTELGDHFLAAIHMFYGRLVDRKRKTIQEKYKEPWELEDVNSWRMPPNIYRVKLGISQEQPSFNGDVMLLNIPLLTKGEFFKNGLNLLFRDRWRTLTEAVYMKLLKHKMIRLEMEWNVPSSHDPYDEWGTLDADETEEYTELVRHAKVFHFMGAANKKPWINPAAPLGWLWWKYARETPFYERVLSMTIGTMVETRGSETEAYAKKMLNEWRKMPSIKLKMRILRLVRQFTFGKTRRNLKEKERALKTRIRKFRAMIR